MMFTTSKEALLEFWQKVERDTGLKISYQEVVQKIEKTGDGFIVTTNRGQHPCANVLLAIGRRGTPRKLGVPGEDLPKVVYRLVDPEQYRGQNVLVVGGGDSALEAAVSIAEQPGTTVTLSYRGDSFGRAKAKNRERVSKAESHNNLRVLLRSNVKTIDAGKVNIEQDGDLHNISNDAVIVNAGGILPTGFLKSVGIEVETKFGTA